MAVDEPEEPSKEQPELNTTPKSADVKKGDKDKPLSTDDLYPLFWSLQEYFSQPKRLFETANLSSFKESLAATMGVFQTVHNDARRSLKRKRETDEDDESSNAFNPKYLTSKDLFDLEVYSRLHSLPRWEANNAFRSVISHSDGMSLYKLSLLWTFLFPCLLKLGRDL
jgi:THO complex subunit 1